MNQSSATIPGIELADKTKSKTRKRAKTAEVIPELSWQTRRIVTIGVAFAGLCAAALSAPTLFNLARIGRVPVYLAWLLPACLDGYAITSIQFGNSVPAGHPAHKEAKRNARHALLLSVGGNFAYHVLVLAGSMLPAWIPIALLVVILSLPPFIVDRLLHLHSLAVGTGTADADRGADGGADRHPSAPTTPRRPKVPSTPTGADRSADGGPPSAPTADEPVGTSADGAADESDDGGADVIDMAAAGARVQRNIDQWAEDVLPVYSRWVSTHGGTEPNAPQLAEAIAAVGFGTLGKSRARDVRAATQKLYRQAATARSDRAEATR